MENPITEHKCPECGSSDLAHYEEWFTGETPVGIEGFIGCRVCHYWQKMLTVLPALDVFDHTKWIVLVIGKGTYRNAEEYHAAVRYRNPDADTYARYDWSSRQ